LCGSRLLEFDTVNFVTVLHRVAKTRDGKRYLSDPGFMVIVDGILERFEIFNPQHMSNTAWAVSSLTFLHEPLLEALSAQALTRLTEFDGQNLQNTAWSCAKLQFVDLFLFGATASESPLKMA